MTIDTSTDRSGYPRSVRRSAQGRTWVGLRAVRGLTLLRAGLIVAASLAAWPTVARATEPIVVPTSAGPSLAAPEMVATLPSTDQLRGIGPDGAGGVWFSENTNVLSTAYLDHYRPGVLGLARVLVKPLTNFGQLIDGIAPGPDGNEWFARFYDNRISHITPSGKLVSKALPSTHFNAEPDALTVDGHGNVWFVARGHGCSLGRLSVAGTFTEYDVGGDCGGLTVGPDGNIWVAHYTANLVDEISATTGALLARYDLRLPVGIATVGADILVTEIEPGRIAKIAPSGQVTEYVLPEGRKLEWAAAGPDGAIWFTETAGPSGAGAVGRLTPSGELSETTMPGRGGAAYITATNDAVYFTYGGPEPGFAQGVMRISPPGFVPPDAATYVALGDSYSSGEGNPPYEPETAEESAPSNTCHRSQAAYGPLLDGALGLGPMVFKACSGAVTADIFNPNAKNTTEPGQRTWLKPSTRTVTLTIGGNDAGFVEVLKACLTYTGSFGCSKNKQLSAETHDRLNALAGAAVAWTPPPERLIHSLSSVIEAINAEAPTARIVVGGYPHLFGTNSANYEPAASPSGHVCTIGHYGPIPVEIDYNDAQWLNALGTQLDSVIHKAVMTLQGKGIPVFYADPANFREKLHGHSLCDSGTPWLNALELNSSVPPVPEPSSFHPNASGHALAYEPAFARLLK